MEIKKSVSVLPYNTLRVDVDSKYFLEVDSVDILQEFLKTDVFADNRCFVLGWGSNVLFLKDFDGVILKNMIMWKKVIREDEDFVYVKIGWWENWHKFVQWTIENNYIWVENLVYIPGSVGASPVQNIGAYGVEAGDVVDEVFGVFIDDEWCRSSTSSEWQLTNLGLQLNIWQEEVFSKEECKLWYRTSVFKTELRDKVFVTHVVFKLKKWKKNIEWQFNLSYGWIRKKMEELWIDEKDLNSRKLADIIIEIRRQKLPDWEQVGTAGSFFKNPIISVAKYEELKKEFSDLVGFEVKVENQTMIKLSAGQLLQVCGWKWKSDGSVGTYHNHALILINHGGGSGQNVADFASTLQKCVWDRYGIVLEPEVRYVGGNE